MRKRGLFIWLATATALVGLLASSTVVAWAAYCSDVCTPVASEHACCASEDDPSQDRATITATSCCDTPHAMACGTVLHYDQGSSSAAHSQSERAAVTTTAPPVAAVLQPQAAPIPPPLPAPIPAPATRTTVLLL